MYPQEAVTEINRCVGEKRMYSIKLWVARRATDPGLNPILEKAVELDVPVLQHAWIKTTGNLRASHSHRMLPTWLTDILRHALL